MKLILIFVTLIFCYFDTLFAQSPQIEWNFKNPGSQRGIPQSITVGPNGSWIVASDSLGISVLDSIGALIGVYTMGPIKVQRVVRNTDGTYYAIGNTPENNFSAYQDGWVARLSPSLDIIWQRICGGDHVDVLVDGAATPDGGLVVSGRSNSVSGDLSGADNPFPGSTFLSWVMKLDATGNIQFSKTYGNNALDGSYNRQGIYKVCPLEDGGYICAGRTFDGGGTGNAGYGYIDGWVARLRDDGNIVWQKMFGGNIGTYITGGTMLPDGNFVISGMAKSLNGFPQSTFPGAFSGLVFRKIDISNGNPVWTKAVGSNTSMEQVSTLSEGKNADVTTDGNLVFAAYLSADIPIMNVPAMGQVYHGKDDYWIIKLNAGNGSLMWHRVMGSGGVSRAYSLMATADGGVICGGNTRGWGLDVNYPDPPPLDYAPWFVKLGACPYQYLITDTICQGSSYVLHGNTYDAAGSYTQNFTSVTGCDSIYKLDLVVDRPTPELVIDSNKVSTGYFTSYQWFKDGNIIPGANGQSYDIFETGSYHVSVTSAKGCAGTSERFYYGKPDDGFQLFPNPATNHITVNWKNMANGADILLFDISGRKISAQHIMTANLTLPVTDLARGVYILEILTDDETVVRKIVKESARQ